MITDKEQPRVPKAFTDEDMAAAKAEWEAGENDKTWDQLRTQTKNKLARDQAYHREHAALCDAIKGARRTPLGGPVQAQLSELPECKGLVSRRLLFWVGDTRFCGHFAKNGYFYNDDPNLAPGQPFTVPSRKLKHERGLSEPSVDAWEYL